MAAQPPRVSIAVPVYNGERYLAQALDALLAQTYTDFEIVISDNASTDGTEAICRAYAARDSRIRYERQALNRGAAWNFNHAFALARGELFRWHAHDDLVEPEFTARCVAALDRDPRAVLAYARTRVIGADGETLYTYDAPFRTDSPDPSVRLHAMICVGHPCFQVFGLIRRAALLHTDLIGPYVPSDKILLAQLCLRGTFYEEPAHLFVSRRHPEQSVRAARLRDRAAWFDPANAGKIVLPQFRSLGEYIKMIRTTPLRPVDRLRCFAILLPWAAADKNWARLANDLVHAGRQLALRAVRTVRGQVLESN